MKTCKLSRNRSSRIGLFGGTFNPIHCGHIQVAMDVLHSFELDRIYFIPSALPPHKSGVKLASAADRLQMVHLALEGLERFEACDIEIKRTGPSYSIDTIRHFKETATGPTELYFIVGVDAFLEIHTWKDFNCIFKHAAMVVMSRSGAGQWSQPMRQQVGSYVKRHIDPGYQLDSKVTRLNHPHLCEIYFASVTPLDLSSSQIRRKFIKGETIRDLVPPQVAEHILRRRLFNG